MITEQQQELATRFSLGELSGPEQEEFCAEVRRNAELREFVHSLHHALDSLAISTPPVEPPPSLKSKILNRIGNGQTPSVQASSAHGTMPAFAAGLRFMDDAAEAGWKPLPVPGTYIKLLSLQSDRGYAVLLGKLDPGARYPAHTNAGPEDFYILTGDLHVGEKVLGPGDFHHADGGSVHGENFSEEGCTLLAVLTTDDPLVQLALG